MSPILRFNDLAKSYGETVALDGLSFEVGAGEVFGLLGPNGAGKSTLIRILMDIIRADRGSMQVFGEVHCRAHLDRIGYLPEERGLYGRQKVLDVMVYLGMLKGLDRRAARERSLAWLDRFDLGHTARWRVERLSKGMTQKVQIACVLLVEPEICVLDEPFSGLDPVNVRLVEGLIADRRKAGRTTILSTHQMNQVEALCDRVTMINRGRRVVYGPIDQVRHAYSRPEVGLDTPAEELPRLVGIEEVVVERPGRFRLLLADSTDPQSVLAALVEADVRVERFERLLAPMADIFIQVVADDAPTESEEVM